MKKTVNPVWNETFTISSLSSYDRSLSLLFSIKDYNALGASVDLGSYSLCVWDLIDLSSISKMSTSESNLANVPIKKEFWTAPGDIQGGADAILHLSLEFTRTTYESSKKEVEHSRTLSSSSLNQDDNFSVHSKKSGIFSRFSNK